MPAPVASPLPSPCGVRSMDQSAAPDVACALRRASASTVKMRPSATTGSAVIRVRCPSPTPIGTLQINWGFAPNVGWIVRVRAVPCPWVQFAFMLILGARKATDLLTISARAGASWIRVSTASRFPGMTGCGCSHPARAMAQTVNVATTRNIIPPVPYLWGAIARLGPAPWQSSTVLHVDASLE